MLTFLTMLPTYVFAAAAEGGSSLADILSMASELLTWVITSMGSILTFIQAHPLIMIFMIITIVGFAVGLLFRIWHSVS